MERRSSPPERAREAAGHWEIGGRGNDDDGEPATGGGGPLDAARGEGLTVTTRSWRKLADQRRVVLGEPLEQALDALEQSAGQCGTG